MEPLPLPERAAPSRSRTAATAQEAELADGNKDARPQPGEARARRCVRAPRAGALLTRALLPAQPGYRHHAAIPEAARLDYVRRPESRVRRHAAAPRLARSSAERPLARACARR